MTPATGLVTPASKPGWLNTTIEGFTEDDTFASYSNHGPDVDIFAPGTCVASSNWVNPDGAPTYQTGTSMAAPHVTGVAALVHSLHPDWSYGQIIQQILDTVDFDTPDSQPSARTRSSTLRVLVPVM